MSSFLGFSDYAPLRTTYAAPTTGHVKAVRRHRQPGASFTAAEMRRRTGLTDQQTRSAITVLMKSGLVTVEKSGHKATYWWVR